MLIRKAPIWFVVGVYGSTYATANTIDAVCERALDPHSERSPFIHAMIKLFGVTAVSPCLASLFLPAPIRTLTSASPCISTAARPRPCLGLAPAARDPPTDSLPYL